MNDTKPVAEILNDTTVRIFRSESSGSLRNGFWAMTKSTGNRGAYFHGGRNEIQAPAYTLESLLKLRHAETSPGWAYAELDNWPEGQSQFLEICKRHQSTEKIIAYKMSRPDCGGWMFIGTDAQDVAKAIESEISDNIDPAIPIEHQVEDRGELLIAPFLTTQKEIDELPEFEGW